MKTNKLLASLDIFTRHYLLAALWTEDDDAPSGEYSTSGRPEKLFPRFPQKSLEKAQTDCVRFQSDNKALLIASGMDDKNAGHNFWLTRNGHGTGFWDRDLPDDTGEKLTLAAKEFGEVWMYRGRGGWFYFSQ
jgi:hypothetical protein